MKDKCAEQKLCGTKRERDRKSETAWLEWLNEFPSDVM